jgi:phospholipid/cholesterol/gamma-HCH transport system substrate-binding protein
MGGSKLVRYQLIAFVLVTVLGVTYAMVQYVGLGQILGIGQFPVSVRMPQAGGLYQGAVVTERGVTVGKVTGLHLSPQGGVVADFNLDDGTEIPASGLKAAVANTSAVGEQYLELTPQQSGPPYLKPGSVIPASEVTLPPDPSTLLANVNALLSAVPQKQLNVTINELYDAFNGSGPQLQQLLDSAGQLLTAAQQNLAPTKALATESEPVLQTQAANSAAIESFSRNLASFTDQLRASNSDLAGALDQGPGTIGELNDLISQLQPTLPLLLANLTSIGQVTDMYVPNLRQLLVITPAGVNDLTSAIMNSPVPGSSNVDFNLDVNNPAPCEQGYDTPMRSPTDTSAAPLPAQAPYCTASNSSQQDVRGARNDPCPNNPGIQSATAAGCGLYFGGYTKADSSDDITSSEDAGSLFVGPNGLLYSVGAGTVLGNGPTTLSGLLQQTLGN